MAAPKGHARYGGRTKGTPNTSTSLSIRLTHLGLDPVDTAVRIIQKKTTSDSDKLQACFRLIDKLYPTPKAIELTHTNAGGNIQITLVEALAMARGIRDAQVIDTTKQIQ